MPPASDYLRTKWAGESEAIAFLEKQGFYLTNFWTWIKPTPDHELSIDEAEAIYFLQEEHKHGGISKPSRH